jgi:hypothetical protein
MTADVAIEPKRTPLSAMSDEQLQFIAEDELVPPWRRAIAAMLLAERRT